MSSVRTSERGSSSRAIAPLLLSSAALPFVLVFPTLGVVLGFAADAFCWRALRAGPMGHQRTIAIAGAVLGTISIIAVCFVVLLLSGAKSGSGFSFVTPGAATT